MVLNTAASIAFSQVNSTVFFTNGNLGVNTTSPTANLDVNGSINISNLSSLVNVTATNVSSSNVISTTSISSGALLATNVTSTNITAGTLSASTITASNLSLSGNLNIGGTLTTVNITSTNIKDTNISTGTLNASGLSILTNVTATGISSENFIASTGITSGAINLLAGNSTIANVNVTNISTGIVKVTTGVTTGTITLSSGQASLGNVTATNISSSSLNASGTSILTNTIATNVSAGTGIASTGITTGTINATGLSTLANTTVTNISTGGLNASGTSVLTNTIVTNISTGTINASGTSILTNTIATNISAAVLIASTGITSGSIRGAILTATTITVPNIISTNITSSRLEMSGTTNLLSQFVTDTSSVYTEFNKASSTVRGLVGLDGGGYSGLSGSLSISTWTNHPIYFLINGANRMAIDTNGYVGIGKTNPQYLLDVQGTIASVGSRLPIFRNGTFSGASTATIPILFGDTGYNVVEIKIRFTQSNGSINITLSGNNGSGTNFNIYEQNERTVKYSSQSSPIYTQSGLIATFSEAGGNDAICTITIAQASGTSYGNRYHYMFDTTYCWAGVGATRVYGSGFLSTAVGNQARQPLANIILTCGAGTISGTYSTQHSY